MFIVHATNAACIGVTFDESFKPPFLLVRAQFPEGEGALWRAGDCVPDINVEDAVFYKKVLKPTVLAQLQGLGAVRNMVPSNTEVAGDLRTQFDKAVAGCSPALLVEPGEVEARDVVVRGGVFRVPQAMWHRHDDPTKPGIYVVAYDLRDDGTGGVLVGADSMHFSYWDGARWSTAAHAADVGSVVAGRFITYVEPGCSPFPPRADDPHGDLSKGGKLLWAMPWAAAYRLQSALENFTGGAIDEAEDAASAS
jgi:hypothetical protein